MGAILNIPGPLFITFAILLLAAMLYPAFGDQLNDMFATYSNNVVADAATSALQPPDIKP